MENMGFIEKNKILLKELINDLNNGEASVYNQNSEVILKIYKNYKKNKIAGSIYKEEFEKLKENQFGKIILESLDGKIYEEDSTEEVKLMKQQLEKEIEKNARHYSASRNERFVGVALYMALNKQGLLDNIGYLTHRQFRTEEFIDHLLNGTEKKSNNNDRRESDIIIVNKKTGESYIILYDGASFHNSENDNLSSLILSKHGKVIRIREKGVDKVDENLCISLEIKCLKINQKGVQNNYNEITIEINSLLNKFGDIIPELKGCRFSESEVREMVDNLDDKYEDICYLNPLNQMSKKEKRRLDYVADMALNKTYKNDKKMYGLILDLHLTSKFKESICVNDTESEKYVKAFKEFKKIGNRVNYANKKRDKENNTNN